MSTIGAPSIPDDISIFEQSSPESLRARALPQGPARTFSPHEYSSSTSDDHTLTDDDYFVDHKPLKQCHSSRSSISSFPASVIHNVPFTDTEDVDFRTPSRSHTADRFKGSPSHGYLAAFRNPSSVRALQLESEYTDSDTMSLRNSERMMRSPKNSRYGARSPASIHSSPTKRSSRPGTPQQRAYSSSKLKKEFPLVLLHCTLLAPAVTVAGPQVSSEIMEAVLPEEYRKRWQMLQDKVAKNSEVRQRGVLISHPREDYDVLEESLLETLELERPRIRRGHYLGNGKGGDSDSGFESSSQNGSDDASDEEGCGHKCPDCGKAVSTDVEQEKKWEVKVFAANGLMRSGAWSAAWEQMEKVDVEVSVWMPTSIRTEVEERLKALQAKEEAERPVEPSPEVKRRSKRARSNTAKLRHDERMREIYGQPPLSKTQDEIDGLVDEEVKKDGDHHSQHPGTSTAEPHTEPRPEDLATPQDQPTPALVVVPEDFPTFMRRHLQLICSDQKNVAIVLLSIMVLIFSIQNATVGPIQATTTDGTAGPAIASPTSMHGITQESGPVSYLTTTIYAEPSKVASVSSMPELHQAVHEPKAERGINMDEAPVFPAEVVLDVLPETEVADEFGSTSDVTVEFRAGYAESSEPSEEQELEVNEMKLEKLTQEDLAETFTSVIMDTLKEEGGEASLQGSNTPEPCTEDAALEVTAQVENVNNMADRSSENSNYPEVRSEETELHLSVLKVADNQETLDDTASVIPGDANVVDQEIDSEEPEVEINSDRLDDEVSRVLEFDIQIQDEDIVLEQEM